MEAVIDTNVLIHDYIEDSELHASAKQVLDTYDSWLVPSVVIEEMVFALKRLGIDDHLIAGRLRELLLGGRVTVLPVGRMEILGALETLSSEKASMVRFNDKLVLSAAKRRRTGLATFDRGLRSECRTLGVEAIPGTASARARP